MIRTIKTGLAFAGLAGLFLLQAPASAQDKMKPDTMKQDDVKNEKMQDDKMMHEGMAKTLFTGKFHGKVHATSGRATVKCASSSLRISFEMLVISPKFFAPRT